MSIYTQTQLDNARSAYIALAIGAQVVRLRIGTSKEIEYQPADMDRLKARISEMEQDIYGGSLRTYAKNGRRGA